MLELPKQGGDLRDDPDGPLLLAQLAKLVEAVDFIEQAFPPACFIEHFPRFSVWKPPDCRWRKFQQLYKGLKHWEVRDPVLIARRKLHPQIRIVDGSKRAAILLATDRPIPYVREWPPYEIPAKQE